MFRKNLTHQDDLISQDQTNALLATKKHQAWYNDVVAFNQATFSRG